MPTRFALVARTSLDQKDEASNRETGTSQ